MLLMSSSFSFRSKNQKTKDCIYIISTILSLLLIITAAQATDLSDAANPLQPVQSYKITTDNLASAADRAGSTIDIYPGTNVFKTAAENLKPGETLIVHQGTYIEEQRMSIRGEGTSESPIIIKGAEGEARPVITRSAGAPIQNVINIEGSAKHLTIQGLEITSPGNGDSDGIRLNGDLSQITIHDNVIHNVSVGIGAHTDMNNLIITKNHIYNIGVNNGTGEGMYIGCNDADCEITDSIITGNWIHDNLPGTSQGDGIEIKWGSIRNTIKDNVIYNMDYPGIFVYGSSGDDLNVVEGNVIWNCLEGIYAPSDAVVKNNIIFNSGTGLSLYDHKQVDALENITAVNNTVYNCNDGIYIRWSDDSDNVILANNAIYCPDKKSVNTPYSIHGTVRSNYIQGAMDIGIDNLQFFEGGAYAAAFNDAPNNDFWPKTGSILIGKGHADFAPRRDFNENIRSAPNDVGAYATASHEDNPGWQIVEGFKAMGTSTLEWSAANYSVDESSDTADVTIIRTGDASASVAVQWRTFQDSATAGEDYEDIAWSTVTFAEGETTKVMTIQILQDALAEGDETLTISLANPTNCSLGSRTDVSVTIVDDDDATSAPTAAFSCDPNPAEGAAPLTVQFTDDSTGAPTSWQWDFDSDGQIEETTQHPVFTYLTEGEYTVSMTAANAAGESTATMAVRVTAKDSDTSGNGGDGGGCFIASAHAGIFFDE